MPETYKPLSSFTVHAWMPEKMGLQYPELYVYALFSTAGEDGIPATKPVTRDMARLCGISEATFYRVRNRLLMMGLLFSKSFSGSERIYYVTDRKVPLPLEKVKKDPAPSVTRTIAEAERLPEADFSAREYETENNRIASIKSASDSADLAAEKFSQNIKELVAELRASTDTVLYTRDRLLKRLETYCDTFSEGWEDVSEMIDELSAPGGEYEGGGTAPEAESGLFEGTIGDHVAAEREEESHPSDGGASFRASIAVEIGKILSGILGEGEANEG